MIPANLSAITLTEDAAELSIAGGAPQQQWTIPTIYELIGPPPATAMFVIGGREIDLSPGPQTVEGIGTPASLFCEPGGNNIPAKFGLNPYQQASSDGYPIKFMPMLGQNPALTYFWGVSETPVTIQLMVFLTMDEGSSATVNVAVDLGDYQQVPRGLSSYKLNGTGFGFDVYNRQGGGSVYLVFSVVTI